MRCLSSPHGWDVMTSRCHEVKCSFWAALVLGAAGDEMPRPWLLRSGGIWDRSTITKEAVQRFHASVRARMAGVANLRHLLETS